MRWKAARPNRGCSSSCTRNVSVTFDSTASSPRDLLFSSGAPRVFLAPVTIYTWTKWGIWAPKLWYFFFFFFNFFFLASSLLPSVSCSGWGGWAVVINLFSLIFCPFSGLVVMGWRISQKVPPCWVLSCGCPWPGWGSGKQLNQEFWGWPDINHELVQAELGPSTFLYSWESNIYIIYKLQGYK